MVVKIPMTVEGLKAVKVLAAEGIEAKVINIHTIKPLDEDLIVAAAKETGKVVTVEEHSVIGGLGSAVCDALVIAHLTYFQKHLVGLAWNNNILV